MNNYYNLIYNNDGTLKVNTLYDVGENNLNKNDIVMVNDIACYVLEANSNSAKMIAKNIYNQAFIDINGHISNATRDIFGYLDRFYQDHFKDNRYILESTNTYLFNYYPISIKHKLFLLDEKEAMEYSNGYYPEKDKFGNCDIYNKKAIGFLIASFNRNDTYMYGSFITSYGNLQLGYIYDENIGVRPSFYLDLQ